MGLRFYIGASGSGKSYRLYSDIIKEAVENPRRNFLIVVPEQFTMQTQLELVRRHPNRGIMNIDVLSFGRLAHRIFAQAGGNDRPVLDDTGKSLVLRLVAAELEGELGIMKRNVKKLGYISEVKSVISEFMQYGIGVSDVEKLCEFAKKRGVLGLKLKDLHILYKGFMDYINQKFITTEETLDIARGLLGKSQLVRDSVIAFDGFTGFTPVQYKLIQELLTLSREVLVTVTMDAKENPYETDSEQKLFHLSKKTIGDLIRLAGEAGIRHDKNDDIVISEEPVYRYRDNGILSHLERELFRSPYRQYNGELILNGASNPDMGIRIMEISNPRQELRQVCMEIRQLIKDKGYAYRDIAIVTGDMERYAFIAREEFERLNIPYFIDQNNRLVLNPFIEFIRSALLIVIKDFSYESVFHFLRSGLADITPDKADRLEDYVLSLGIRGKSAWKKKFTRSTRHIQDNGELEELDKIRSEIVELISPLMIKSASGQTYVKALYDFIKKAGIEEKLFKYEEKFSSGDLERAREYAQIYRLVMELLEQIYALLGEEELSLEEFAQILDAGFAEIKVGIIPQNVDKVVLGDIERTRLGDIRALFFIGVNDTIIPKSGGGGGIISDIDREFLLGSEYALSPTPRQQMYIQKLYLYMMMTKPTEQLILSYSKTDNEGKSLRPSYLINMALKLFPTLKITYPQLRPINEQINSYADGLEYMVDMLRGYAQDGLEGEKEDKRKLFFTLYDSFVSNETYSDLTGQLNKAAFYHYNTKSGCSHMNIPKELAVQLYGSILQNSASRLERFAACAYAHFLQYGIRLSERDKYSFESVDMGNIFHAVLEEFGDKLKENNRTWFDFESELGERLVSECVDRYAASYGETILYSTKRNEYIITRIKKILTRTVRTLQYQLRQGVFAPDKLEMSFNMTSDLDAVNISLSENEKLRLTGRIDRVDTYRDDDKLYVKIIDYKSGKKSFDLAALYYGLQLQLVIYMNAAVEMEKRINPEATVIPAAMLYYHVDNPMADDEKGSLTMEQIEEEILSELKMTGIVNSDEEVIRLMDRDFEDKSKVLPVSKKKGGGYTASSGVLSNEGFDTISEYVNLRIKEIGSSIINGDISLNPYELGDDGACTYCAFKGVCGFDRKLGQGLVRHLDELDDESAIALMKEENEKEQKGTNK